MSGEYEPENYRTTYHPDVYAERWAGGAEASRRVRPRGPNDEKGLETAGTATSAALPVDHLTAAVTPVHHPAAHGGAPLRLGLIGFGAIGCELTRLVNGVCRNGFRALASRPCRRRGPTHPRLG